MVGHEDAALNYATLSCDFVAHSHNKIARENGKCDIGLSGTATTRCTSGVTVIQSG